MRCSEIEGWNPAALWREIPKGHRRAGAEAGRAWRRSPAGLNTTRLVPFGFGSTPDLDLIVAGFAGYIAGRKLNAKGVDLGIRDRRAKVLARGRIIGAIIAHPRP